MLSKLSLDDPEKRNHSWMDTVVTDIISKGLRILFKQEWDNRYRLSHGPWDDKTTSGMQLIHMEKPRKIPTKYIAKFASGDTSDWDCSALFDAILYSKSIGNASLSPSVRNEVDNLRIIRNEVKHATEGNLPEKDFQLLVTKVETSMKVLGLSTSDIAQLKVEKNRYSSFQVLPSKPAHKVVSRTDLVSKISKDLQELYSNNNHELTYLYISGNPGSGKSQLARQVAENFYLQEMNNPTEMTFVMTMNANDLNSLMNSYVEFCRRLNCNEKKLVNITNSTNTKEEKILHLRTLVAVSVKHWKRWLLIVDNVENLAKISPLLPNLGEDDWNNGQIIITTQDSSSIPLNSKFTKHVSVSTGMNVQECRELLNSLSQTNFDDDQLDEVAMKLDRQPLAIAAAAVYLRRVIESKSSPEFSWQDYLKKFEDGKREITEKQLCEMNLVYTLTMSAAVFLAVEKSAENSILNHAFHFLAFVSFDPLPIDIIINHIQEIDRGLDREEIGLNIAQCSLFLPVEDKNHNIRVHHVVHEALKKFCDSKRRKVQNTPCTRKERQKKEEDMSKKVHDVARSLHRFECRDDKVKLIPHLKAFHAAMKKIYPGTETLFPIITSSPSCKEEISHISLFFGIVSRDFCEYNLSVEFLQIILQVWKGSKQNNFVATTYIELGMLHRVLGQLQKAKDYFQRAMNILTTRLGPDDVSVAASYNNVGSVHRCLGELQQAKDYYQRALKIRVDRLAPNNVDVATSYNSLGVLKHDLGELQEAKDYLQRALDIRIEKFGKTHVDVASSYNHLGALHHELGDLQKAKDYYGRALDIRRELLGPNHANIATSYNSLGALHHDLGELEEALDYHKRALDIRTKLFGQIHVNVATSCDSLGKLYHDLGELQLANDFLQRGLEIRVQKLGEDHVHVASSRNHLGSVYHDLHEEEQAKQFFHRALDIWIEQFGPNHFHVASSYYNLGKLYQDLSDLQQAEKYHQQALEIRTKLLSPNNIHTANSYFALGQVYEARGELEKAMEHHERALHIRSIQFGQNHFAVARSGERLSLIYKKLGYHEKAEECHQRVVSIQKV